MVKNLLKPLVKLLFSHRRLGHVTPKTARSYVLLCVTRKAVDPVYTVVDDSGQFRSLFGYSGAPSFSGFRRIGRKRRSGTRPAVITTGKDQAGCKLFGQTPRQTSCLCIMEYSTKEGVNGSVLRIYGLGRVRHVFAPTTTARSEPRLDKMLLSFQDSTATVTLALPSVLSNPSAGTTLNTANNGQNSESVSRLNHSGLQSYTIIPQFGVTCNGIR
jgi:hypothetical protein